MGKNKYGEYRYRRFMAPETTQRFYTTLLLHAMAPRQSMEALFNILFDFYAKYLDFQYVEEDISFKVLTREMRARWDSSVFRSDTLHLRGDAVYSGLQCLFQQRPEYMAVQCDSLVRKIDLILRGEERGALDPERNYWDRLLLDWYEKKSGTERARIQDTRRSRKTEYVATSKDRIQVSYVLQNETAGLSFPRIRLPSVEEQNPVFRVYQGDSLLYEDTLSVTGNRNDLCLTTQSRFLPLSAAGYDGAAPLNLRLEIEYGNETLYRSGEKLNRPWLLFDGEGRERSQKTGIVWLFADNTRNVEFSGEEGVYLCLHPGQLYRVNLGEVTSITVDGGEVFADERTASRFRHYTSVSRIRMLGAGSPPCDVFPAPFTLTVCLPEGENPIRCRIFADGTPLSPSQADGGFVLTPPDSPAVAHRIYVTDLVSGNTRYAYSYMILPGCKVQPDKHLYRESLDEAEISLSWEGYSGSFRLPVPPCGERLRLSVPGLEEQMEMELPAVRCTFLGASAFAAPETVWHEEITPDEFVTVELPDGWEGLLVLGTRQVPADQTGRRYELGNFLRSGLSFGDRETLFLSLRDGREHTELYKLTDIVFAPGFLRCPLEAEDGRLLWRAAGNFYGGTDGRFSVFIVQPDGEERQFETGCADETLLDGGLPDGAYRCKVSLKQRSVFARGPGKVLYEGRFFSGNPLAFAYAGREIRTGDAHCWDFSRKRLKLVPMRPGCGVLRDFQFRGITVASGEADPAPQYTATLYYTNQYGELHPFSSRASDKYEQINPVNIWIINEHLLILQDANGDGLYIDNQYTTIVNRNPDSYLSRAEQRKRLETPDYFHYQVQEE